MTDPLGDRGSLSKAASAVERSDLRGRSTYSLGSKLVGPRVLRAVDWRRWRKEMRGMEGFTGPSELEHVAECAINEEEKIKMMMIKMK